jgi:hypothetical protein
MASRSVPAKNTLLSIIGEEGKEGVEDGAEEKCDPRSLVDLKGDFDPSMPRADLEKNQKQVQDTQD